MRPGQDRVDCVYDTIEDAGISASVIEGRFGVNVANLVVSATEPNKKAPWEERKQHTIDSLKTATEDALLVSLADKLDNLRAMLRDHENHGEALWTRFKRSRDAQANYYRSLAAVFSHRLQQAPGAALAAEFARGVDSLFGPPAPKS